MGTKRLLVVDDEADFGRFVARVAGALDYDVETTTNATDFMARFHSFDPDIVVLDIVMPEMDGVELVQWLVSVKCRARIIIISGYNPLYAQLAESLAAAQGILSVSTMTKPIKLADLRAILTVGAEGSIQAFK
ncbi:MAG TPA: response regulator [Aliidongia sp.]|nr:response regulator [Aliidongia sp.]